ncbi:MAG: hypothetical protein P4L87_24220 [Formivibrio sp.]|nr:hypothetical protein [Formivibrio sp.]
MGFFDSIGGFFSDAYHATANFVNDNIIHPVSSGVTSVYNSVVKPVAVDAYNGGKSLINRSVDFAEKVGDKGLNYADSINNLLGSPLVIGGGIILAIIILSKVK